MTRPTSTARRASLVAIALALALVTTACAGARPTEEQDSDKEKRRGAAAAATGPDAEVRKVSRRQWDAMVDAGMVRPECPIQRPAALRVVEINHFDFNGDVKRGRLVVNVDIAESVPRIFSELYDQQFPIRRMKPVEAFGGDTNLSLAADNTSAFNCRRADQINAPFAASPHANGRAVDINPRENPLARPALQVLVPWSGQHTAYRRAGEDHERRIRMARNAGRGVDLAEHRRSGLHALRHRLPLATI